MCLPIWKQALTNPVVKATLHHNKILVTGGIGPYQYGMDGNIISGLPVSNISPGLHTSRCSIKTDVRPAVTSQLISRPPFRLAFRLLPVLMREMG